MLSWLQTPQNSTVSSTLYNNRKSSLTGLQGVTGTLDNSGGSDGNVTAIFKFVPVNGLERQISRTFTFNGTITSTVYVSDQGDDSSGDGTSGNPYLTVERALGSFGSGPGIVKCMAGATGRVRIDAASTPSLHNHAFCSIVELDDGLSYGDVTLYLSSPAVYESRHRKVQFENLRFDMDTVVRVTVQVSDAKVVFKDCGFVAVTNGAGGPSVGRSTVPGGSPPADDQGWVGSTFSVTDGTIGLIGVREWVGYTGPTGGIVLGGGYGGNHIIAYHGGDHRYGGWLFGGVGWSKATGVEALIRYTDDYYVNAGSVTDNLDGTNTLNLSGTPTLNVASMTSESSTRVRVITGSLTGTQFPITAADDTAKTITVTGDATALDPADDLLVVSVQHSDLSQDDMPNPGGNRLLQAVDARDLNSAVQMRLPQIGGTVGEVIGVAMQLVAFNQKVGSSIGYQEENETNCRFDHCTFVNSNFTNTTGATATDCTLANTVIDQIASGWNSAKVVSEAGTAEAGLEIDASPDYAATTLVPNGIGLQGATMPLFPYDLAGNIIKRDGSAMVGAYQSQVSITDVSPGSVANGASGELTITGTGFIAGAAIAADAGMSLGTLTVNSGAEAKCSYTGTAPGTTKLTLTNPDGQAATHEIEVTGLVSAGVQVASGGSRVERIGERFTR